MNILIDGRVWSKNAAGITTFLCCALTEWARQRPSDTFYVILPSGFDPRVEVGETLPNLKLLDYSRHCPQWLPNIVNIQFLMPWLCRKLKADLYYAPVPHLPYFLPRRTRKMVTVHDVVHIEMRDTMSWTNRLATRYFFARAIKKADLLWANSYYTRDKVDEYFPRRRCKVGNAADRRMYYELHLGEEEKAAIRAKHGIKGRFLLFVGSLEPRKNLSFLLSVIPELYRQHQVQLVVVGGKGWKNSDLRTVVEAPDFPREAVIFCGYLTNRELLELYNTADSFVSAALTEGFGMPQLEALLCGCQVVTAHNTAMIEVARAKDGATTVEGYDVGHWHQAIVRALDEHPQVNQSQLREYDWKDIIRRLITFIEKLNIAASRRSCSRSAQFKHVWLCSRFIATLKIFTFRNQQYKNKHDYKK